MFVSQVEEAIPGISATDVDTRKDKHFVKWFGANNCVSRSVSATIKGYYAGGYPNWSMTPNHLEKTGVLPSLSELFKMTHATSDGVFVDPAFEKLFHAVVARIEERETQLTQQSPDGLPVTLTTEEADRIFEEVAPKKKGRIVGIGYVNEVERTTSSYTSRRDEETSQMKARMDSQQVRLDSLEYLLDVMAVGNLHRNVYVFFTTKMFTCALHRNH
uniref:Uncharacterized protein n=1 Tax=Brassica oleracea var. oleracea TaxID=109376 RepID=A0A0D2ZPM5_BRAOL